MDVNTLFLNILRAALRGQRYDPPDTVTAEQWQTILGIAAIHKVEPLIWEAVYASGALQSAVPELVAPLKQQVRQLVILQTLRTSEFLELNMQLREAGIDAIVVKGITCRDLYPSPDHRPSADEDVLIRAEQFDACRAVFDRFGLKTHLDEQKAADAFEVPYRKPGSPLYIELHKQLFSDTSDAYGDLNRFFGDVFDRSVEISACSGQVRTMAPTDHLFYLICHAFKHFLHSGFGVRQICDILLFAERYEDQINWGLVLENCRSIRADRFAAAIFDIGRSHLGFEPILRFPVEADGTALLSDVLSAGVYGTAGDSRAHSSHVTLEAVAAQKEGRKAKGLMASAFPSAKALEGRYPWLKDRPWLLPAAWADRIAAYAKKTDSGSEAAEALKLGSERVALLRQYGIIE